MQNIFIKSARKKMVATLLKFFFRENAKALRFDALIDKEKFMYKSEHGHNTLYNSTQGKGKN
jgi:hypothetical protein